jgi:hypothetical protein
MLRATKKRQRLVSIFALLALLSVMFSVPVLADHPGDQLGASVAPQFVAGNPTCSDLLDADDFEFETKIEPVVSGTYDLDGNLDPDGPITITVRDTAQGQVFDFELDGFVTMGVVVKGGPDANFYDYRPGGVSSDVDLHAPVNHNNNRFFGLSHISLCLVEAPETGAIEVNKTAKQADAEGGEIALEGVDFEIYDSAGNLVDTITTDENGRACIDGLAFGDYVVREIVPEGYADVDDIDVTVDEAADCEGEGNPAVVNIDNVPLTDVEIIVTSQVEGATKWLIECTDSEGNTYDNHGGTFEFSTDGLTVNDLLPTAPEVTLTCEITIDP